MMGIGNGFSRIRLIAPAGKGGMGQQKNGESGFLG